jgi:hypothetical protein
MPEAYELGGSSVSYATIIGFLVGFLISTEQQFQIQTVT